MALGVGTAVGPIDEPEPAAHGGDDHAGEEAGHDGGHDAEEVGLPGGLAVSEDGYTLRLERATAERRTAAARGVPRRGSGRRARHGVRRRARKRLHLIAVRRDFAGYQHVHPVLAADGTWSTRLDLSPGAWRLFADFNPTGGVGTTLGADLSVDGDYRAAEPTARTPAPRGSATTPSPSTVTSSPAAPRS